jgi:predicted dehydrogenase
VAGEFAIPRVHEDWRDVVEADDVDAVFICTPPHMHADATVRALEAGKHVFCQARMADTLENARRMLGAAQQRDAVTMLCPPPHYMAVGSYVRDLIYGSEVLGDLRHVVVHHVSGMFAEPQPPLHWRQREDLNGINVLDVGIVAEVLQSWFGPVSEVAATESVWVSERPRDTEGHTAVEEPDTVGVVGRFASGASLVGIFSGAAGEGESYLTVHGTRASLKCLPNSATLELREDGHVRLITVPPAEQVRWSAERDFVDAVRHGTQPRPSFRDGVDYMALTHAIREAARTGSRLGVGD